MANPVQEHNDLLRKPLYRLSHPNLVTSQILTVRSVQSASRVFVEPVPARCHSYLPQPEEHVPQPRGESARADEEISPSQSTACALCKASFPSSIEQRGHVRSDFHRYNLKLRMGGLHAVDESTFTNLIGDLDESLSGSESSDSRSEEDESSGKPSDSTLTALLKRQARLSGQHDDDAEPNAKQKQRGSGNPPLLWLSNSKLPENVSLGIYRALLTEAERDRDLVETIKQKQLKPVQAKHSGAGIQSSTQVLVVQSPHYFLCMIGGGHFAAMIVSLAPEIRKGVGGQEERHAIIKAHRTFHRYTTRRKQGGSQSANDNAKGNAHSAGSSIRRYNEMALEADVRGVLSEWKEMIASSELLFVRATGSTSRKTLYGPYDGQILRANDTRVRGFPFSTRRATQAELMRSFNELTRLKISTLSQSAPTMAAAEPEKATKSLKSELPLHEPTSKLSKNEEMALMHTMQIQTLIRRTKAPALLSYLKNNDLSSNFLFFPPSTPQNHHAPNLLHLASSSNSPALVLALLIQAEADPTLTNEDGKTAFDLAADTKTRDAFRIARHSLGESTFDWKAAHVPSALSEQEAENRQKREKEEESTAEAQRRKINLEKLRQEEEAQKTSNTERRAGIGHGLGTRDKTGAEIREVEGRGLTPEMRLKLERERRAHAAEERIKQMR